MGNAEDWYTTVKEGNDPFAGTVALFENTQESSDARYWVEHQRKGIETDYMTLDEANAKYDEFVSDSMF